MAPERGDWDDTGTFPALSAVQLRGWALALAGLCGAGIGVTSGLAWRRFEAGDNEMALTIVALSVLLAAVMLFLVLQARVIAQLIERRSNRGHRHGALERRLLALEFEVAASRSDRATTAEPTPQQSEEDVSRS